jgi:hypothetical protein
MEAKYQVKQVRLQKTYAPKATVTLLTRVIGISRLRHELYGFGVKKSQITSTFSQEH